MGLQILLLWAVGSSKCYRSVSEKDSQIINKSQEQAKQGVNFWMIESLKFSKYWLLEFSFVFSEKSFVHLGVVRILNLCCWFLLHITRNRMGYLNPFKPKVWDRYEILGGGTKRHPLEINKGAPWDLMLLQVILKPIKVMTHGNQCNSLNFWDTGIIFRI